MAWDGLAYEKTCIQQRFTSAHPTPLSAWDKTSATSDWNSADTTMDTTEQHAPAGKSTRELSRRPE